MRIYVLYPMLAVLVFFGWTAHAAQYTYQSYDEIVDKLQRRNDGSVIRPQKNSGLLDGEIHGGIGLSQTFFQSTSSDGDFNGMGHNGLFLSLGTDIFNPRWSIEGSFQNFGRSQGDETTFSLKEFSAKFFHNSQLSYRWILRLGAGMSLRFLNISDLITKSSQSHVTPGIALTVGADTFLSDSLSVGADLNYKNAISQNTVDNRSIDLSIRFDLHF